MSDSPRTDENTATSADNGEPRQDNKAEKESEKADSIAKECDTPKAPEVDKKALKEQFEAYGKFGDKTADGKTITTTDTGIAFRKISKNSPKLSFTDWNKYLDEIANNKKVDANALKGKLVECGKPGFTGATKISQNSAMERLTDTSKYGGTHKQRFTPDGKGKGKEGRVDDKPLAFREVRKASRS